MVQWLAHQPDLAGQVRRGVRRRRVMTVGPIAAVLAVILMLGSIWASHPGRSSKVATAQSACTALLTSTPPQWAHAGFSGPGLQTVGRLYWENHSDEVTATALKVNPVEVRRIVYGLSHAHTRLVEAEDQVCTFCGRRRADVAYLRALGCSSAAPAARPGQLFSTAWMPHPKAGNGSRPTVCRSATSVVEPTDRMSPSKAMPAFASAGGAWTSAWTAPTDYRSADAAAPQRVTPVRAPTSPRPLRTRRAPIPVARRPVAKPADHARARAAMVASPPDGSRRRRPRRRRRPTESAT